MSERTLTLRVDGRAHEVRADVTDGRVRVEAAALEVATGWQLKPEGLCRGGTCVPRFALGGDPAAGIDLAALAQAIGARIEIDLEAGVVVFDHPG